TSLVYKTRQASGNYGTVALPLTLQGLTAKTDSAGVISYADGTGTTVAQTPVPRAWDARLGGTPEGPGAGPIDKAQSTIRTSSGTSLSRTSGQGLTTAASGSLTDQLQLPIDLVNDSSATYPL